MTDTLRDDLTADEAISLAWHAVRDALRVTNALRDAGVTSKDERMIAANRAYDEAVARLDEEMQR